MYEQYTLNTSHKIHEYKDRLKRLLSSIAYIEDKLLNSPDLSSINKSKLVNLFTNGITRSDTIEITNPRVLTFYYTHMELTREANKIRKELAVIDSGIITAKVYKAIIKKFNSKILDWLLRGGYLLRVKGLSFIAVRTKENLSTKRRIDWGTSNKRKKAIIERGEIPFQSIKNEAGEIIGNNGGEHWLTYMDKRYDTWYYWNKSKSIIVNCSLYSFSVPYKNIARLGKIINGDSLAYLKYMI